MCYSTQILLIILTSIFCLPPPKPQYGLNTFTKLGNLVKKNPNSKNLKNNLKDNAATTYIDSNTAVINITKDENIEEHELILATRDLPSGAYFNSYTISISKAKGKSIKIISHSCYKNLESKNECQSSLKEEDDKYNFVYSFQLYTNEKLYIKYKYSYTSETRGLYYLQEVVKIPSINSARKCNFKIIIPKNYKSLGLKYNKLKRESNYVYSYNDNCPSEDLVDLIRISPEKTYWKADMSYYVESAEPISNNITLAFLRMYKGGKNRNKNYKLRTYENVVLNDSELIKDEIYVKAELPGKNNNKIGVNLHTSFINNLNNDFIVYTSDEFYDLDQNIDDAIKAKVDEILKDSKYKDYPDYEKIGKFVYDYMTYDFSYYGKKLTPIQIFNKKRGVCKHYTLLYNTMLNCIGIKTLIILGYGFQVKETSANEKTIGHAWSGALIDGKLKELDATWDLFEGISGAHIFKGFTREVYSYNGAGKKMKISIAHNIQMIDNLDIEEKDSTFIETQLIYNEEEDKKSQSGEPTNNNKTEESSKVTIDKEQEEDSSKVTIDKEQEEDSSKVTTDKEQEEDSSDAIEIIRTTRGYALKNKVPIYLYMISLLILL